MGVSCCSRHCSIWVFTAFNILRVVRVSHSSCYLGIANVHSVSKDSLLQMDNKNCQFPWTHLNLGETACCGDVPQLWAVFVAFSLPKSFILSPMRSPSFNKSHLFRSDPGGFSPKCNRRHILITRKGKKFFFPRKYLEITDRSIWKGEV